MSETAAPNKPASRSKTEAPRPEAEQEAADPKQRKPRAEHHAELLMGLANQSSVDVAEPLGLRRMLNEKQVLEILPVSQTTLWRMERDGRFPRGSFISPNTKIWWADEVAAWQREVDGRRRGRRKQPSREQRKAAARKAAITKAKNRAAETA